MRIARACASQYLDCNRREKAGQILEDFWGEGMRRDLIYTVQAVGVAALAGLTKLPQSESAKMAGTVETFVHMQMAGRFLAKSGSQNLWHQLADQRECVGQANRFKAAFPAIVGGPDQHIRP